MELLKVERLDKKFGPHYALSNISFNIRKGEVHALVGENGAGKSTLIKVLSGVYPPDHGAIYWNGAKISIPDPLTARKLGINVVHQDRHLIPSFTGYENVYLGIDYPQSFWGLGVKWRLMRQRVDALLQELGISLDLGKVAARMSPPEKTMLEIVRAMMLECQLLILDEPTAALTDQEAEQLFALMKKLTSQGTSILYVSHRLEEIFNISDRITVFRNGQYVRTEPTANIRMDQLIHWMSEAVISKEEGQQRTASRNRLLEIADWTTTDQRVKNVNLNVRQGEIVGVFGLAGAGRTELLESIYGLRRMHSGTLCLSDQHIKAHSPREALNHGIVLIPEERKRDALVMNGSIRENMTLPMIHEYGNLWRMRTQKEQRTVKHWLHEMKVKALNGEQSVGQLSGGNQQKVVFAKALLSQPKVFLCDEPTQAVDVVTREEIHRLLREQAKEGHGILFVSSDLQEVLDVSDRIYIMHEGEMIGELDNEQLTTEQVLHLCFNHRRGEEQQHG